MKRINDIKEIEENIEKNPAMLLYVTSTNCNVCKVLKPKIEKLFLKEFPKISLYEVNISDVLEVGSRFNIFSAPVIIIFFDKKEFIKEGRNVSLASLKDRVKKIYDIYFKD